MAVILRGDGVSSGLGPAGFAAVPLSAQRGPDYTRKDRYFSPWPGMNGKNRVETTERVPRPSHGGQ